MGHWEAHYLSFFFVHSKYNTEHKYAKNSGVAIYCTLKYKWKINPPLHCWLIIWFPACSFSPSPQQSHLSVHTWNKGIRWAETRSHATLLYPHSLALLLYFQQRCLSHFRNGDRASTKTLSFPLSTVAFVVVSKIHSRGLSIHARTHARAEFHCFVYKFTAEPRVSL